MNSWAERKPESDFPMGLQNPEEKRTQRGKESFIVVLSPDYILIKKLAKKTSWYLLENFLKKPNSQKSKADHLTLIIDLVDSAPLICLSGSVGIESISG